MARDKGLKIGKSHIWNILRNPIYCGNIYIPTYKNEEAMLVKGKHEPIVSEALFNEVQDVLNGKKRKAINLRKPSANPYCPAAMAFIILWKK